MLAAASNETFKLVSTCVYERYVSSVRLILSHKTRGTRTYDAGLMEPVYAGMLSSLQCDLYKAAGNPTGRNHVRRTKKISQLLRSWSSAIHRNPYSSLCYNIQHLAQHSYIFLHTHTQVRGLATKGLFLPRCEHRQIIPPR